MVVLAIYSKKTVFTMSLLTNYMPQVTSASVYESGTSPLQDNTNTTQIGGGDSLSMTFPASSYTSRGLTTLTASSSPLPDTIKDFVFYSEAVVQPCILCLGLIFNIVNFLVLWKAHIAAMFQLCLLALALSDIFVCIFGVAQLLVEGVVFRGEIPFGYWHGAALSSHLLYYLFLALLCNSSLYVIVAASVRARMISQPYKIIDNTRLHHIKRILGASFAITMLVWLPCPIYAVWQVCYNETDEPRCQEFFRRLPNVHAMQYYFYTLSVVFGPLVIVANVVCFVVINTALRRSTERLSQLKKDSSRRHQYHRITLMLLVILVLDTIWTLPSIVQYIGLVLSPQNTIFNKQNAGYVIYDVIAEVLLLFRPTYNIFVYLITNKEYRLQFVRLFCRSRARSKSALSSLESFSSSPDHSPKRLSKLTNQNAEDIDHQYNGTASEVRGAAGISKPNGIFQNLTPNHKERGLLEDMNSESVHESQTDLQDIHILTEQQSSSGPSVTQDKGTNNGCNV